MHTIRRLEAGDQPALRQFWLEHWGADFMVINGRTYPLESLSAFAALEEDRWVGLVTYIITGAECEIVSLDSLRSGQGIGTALLKEVEQRARLYNCAFLKLITTNDNTRALRFYQKYGFHLAALFPGAVLISRQLKPSIPLLGEDGIPIRDEIELRLNLLDPET